MHLIQRRGASLSVSLEADLDDYIWGRLGKRVRTRLTRILYEGDMFDMGDTLIGEIQNALDEEK